MERMSKNSFFKNKMIVLLLALAFLLFIVNDYTNESADKTAIVVGIGVDKGSDALYQVSCEVIVPKSGGNDASGNKNVVLTGKGDTVAEGIDDVFSKIGWTPKLNYCNLLIISKEVAKDSAINALSYFLRTQKIMDSALVVVSEDNALEVLEGTTPLDSVSAQAVQKIALQKFKQGAGIIEINLKDFTKNYYEEGINDILSIVKSIEADADQSKAEKQESKKDKLEVYDLTSSALFYEGKFVGEIDEKLSNAYNLLKGDAKGSVLSVKDVSVPYLNNGEKVFYELNIIKSKSDIGISLENGKPKVKFDLEIQVQFGDCSVRDKETNISSINNLPQEVTDKAQNDLKFDIMELFQISQKTKSDIFGVGQHLHRFENKKWRKFLLESATPKEYLADTDIEVNVKVIGIEGY